MEAERLRKELIRGEANVSTGMIELLLMKLQRNRADIYLARPTFPRSIEYELETNIRNSGLMNCVTQTSPQNRNHPNKSF